MKAKIFSIDMRDSGGARLSLSYKDAERNGISRISCEVAPQQLVRLVLFAEAISAAHSGDRLDPMSVSLDGLNIRYDVTHMESLTFERQLGYSTQIAPATLRDFLTEMAGIADVCLARAESSKHGSLLKELLSEVPMPHCLSSSLPEDAAEEILYRLREMALLILVDDASHKTSSLARKLRGKKSRPEVCAKVEDLLLTLASEFTPEKKSSDWSTEILPSATQAERL
ncbi:hypothetical protein [Pseudooceanicola spongiae]|uniref:Uncharacterized protein n=1 Tax=Pseudooceanicola spongiae TaxID=2613965 RepID=A0A7L9WJF9_9RHOB|nr:hypothetical protein [Pseudooceanicola spongiae]QOL80369.1 hypothetical protein F3W81_05765 [Pseudooceanicola spongiae]